MKNLSKNKFIFLLLFMQLSSGCRKDPSIVLADPNDSTCVEEWCDDLPEDSGLGYNYIIQGVQYLRPCFNPNNPHEFIYTRVSFSSNIELVKYNIETKEETVLLTPMNQGAADWGSDGWIIFQGAGQSIWKIKDDGSQYSQINGAGGYEPRFGFGGKYFATSGYNPPEIIGNYRPIFDLEGNLVDSIRYEFNNTFTGYPYYPIDSSFHNGYFFFSDHNSLNNSRVGIAQLKDNNTIEELNSFLYSADLIDMEANSGSIIYSVFWNGIYKLNLSTMETTKIKAGCQTRYYMYISISPNGSQYLVEKVICNPINNYDIEENHEIWLFDLNSCEEIRILGQ